MSPTLLEALVVIILVIVAWQLGLILTPIVLRELRSMKRSLDDVSDESLAEAEAEQTLAMKEQHHGTRH